MAHQWVWLPCYPRVLGLEPSTQSLDGVPGAYGAAGGDAPEQGESNGDEWAVVIASVIMLAAPRAEPALAARSRVAVITGADRGVDSVAISGL